jgi:hypothetical protein
MTPNIVELFTTRVKAQQTNLDNPRATPLGLWPRPLETYLKVGTPA